MLVSGRWLYRGMMSMRRRWEGEVVLMQVVVESLTWDVFDWIKVDQVYKRERE